MDMLRRLPVVVGALTALVFATGVAAALVRAGDDSATPTSTSSTTLAMPPTSSAAPTTSSAPTTLAPVTTTTRPVTTTRRPAVTTTVTAAPTMTKPALTRAAATQALCKDIETSVRQVVDGNTLGGGLRLVRAINTYGDAADPAVVTPARRMASAGLNGDLDASAAATQEAAAACGRLGFPITLPGGVQCVTAPCP